MSGHEYTSVFAVDITAFLAFKESVGIVCNSRAWNLWDFDRYCAERRLTDFDRDTVEGWVKYRIDKNPQSVHLSWMSYIRDFGRFMRACGCDAYVLSDRFRAKFVRVKPYLLSSSEIIAFFKEATHPKANSPWAWQAKCFFGLMHSCGLRTCEVRRLAACDIDLDSGFIDILWSKGNRSRRLALTEEVIGMLAECDVRTRAEFGNHRSAFFVSSLGNPVSPCSIGVMFNRIWDDAGLLRSEGGKQPRPYSFRHHFAYANIERWVKEGRDVEAMLPYLARYMGHATFDSTYYYVHTSPDFLAGYAETMRGCESLLPEVGFDG
jgi:integrase